MRVLALDTSLDACAAALLEGDDGILHLSACASRDIGRGHAEVLFDVVREVMDASAADPRTLDRIVVTIGPGSFTGIRVGLAAARGLGVANGIPVVGVTTLEALAADAGPCERPVLALIDARRGEVYAGLFEPVGKDEAAPRPIAPPEALTLAEAADLAAASDAVLVGSGAPLVAAVMPATPAVVSVARFPSIGTVARIGAAREPNGAAPKPLYVRPPDAKPQDAFRIARAEPAEVPS